MLLSCAVRGGQLHVLRLDASLAQWERCGAALRALRSSFAVADASD